MVTSASTQYRISQTRLTSQWIPDSWNHNEHCKNCGANANTGDSFKFETYKCGEYCHQCGARMLNPHYHIVVSSYDYD